MTDPSFVRQRHVTDGRDLAYPPLPEALTVPVYDNHTHLEIVPGGTASTPLRDAEDQRLGLDHARAGDHEQRLFEPDASPQQFHCRPFDCRGRF